MLAQNQNFEHYNSCQQYHSFHVSLNLMRICFKTSAGSLKYSCRFHIYMEKVVEETTFNSTRKLNNNKTKHKNLQSINQSKPHQNSQTNHSLPPPTKKNQLRQTPIQPASQGSKETNRKSTHHLLAVQAKEWKKLYHLLRTFWFIGAYNYRELYHWFSKEDDSGLSWWSTNLWHQGVHPQLV